MQLICQGKDITGAVEIKKADIIDNAGGMADSVEIHFADPLGYWSQWEPQKNDRLELRQDGFRSGTMFVDELEQQRGVFIIQALSIPQEAKTEYSKAWNDVRFLEFAGEIARKYGFQLKVYGIQNHHYKRVDQLEQTDLIFLLHRCQLEGYMLKVNGQSIIIYDERFMESRAPAKIIHQSELDGRYSFKQKSTGTFGSCQVQYAGIRAEYRSETPGPVLKKSDLYMSSQGEAGRFARNLLRATNKEGQPGYCTIALATDIAAGNMVEMKGMGLADGRHFVSQAIHRLAEKKTFLRLRRPLEGY